jgi:hypothetical protein
MSDAVLVALTGLGGVLLTQIGTWISGRRDRALASKTVVTLTNEIEETKRKHQVEMDECYRVISRQRLRLAELGESA